MIVPNQGLTVTDATVTVLRVEVGQAVKKGQAIFEMETDKATQDVVAEVDGVLDEIIAPTGMELPLGTVVAYLRRS